MPTWPSSSKASATTTAADSNSISGARGDINTAITNQNTIIDFFDLGTPGASDDGKVLSYNNTTDKIELVTSSGGSSSTLTLTNTTTGDTILATTTEDSSSAAPVFTLKRNSSSPADADYLGQLKFKGENDADQEVVYAKITAKIGDASDTTEDGILEFANVKAGSNNIGLRLTSTELKMLNGTDLQLTDGNITNDAGSNRGDAFIFGSGNTVETSTSQIVSGVDSDLDIASNSSQRLCGPVQLTKISDLNAWNDRVHSNAVGTKIELSANFGESGSGSERGKARIRNGYQDITLNTKGFQFGDFAFERFGDGLNGGFFSAKAFTDVDNGTAHAHTVRAVTLAPQGDGSDDTLTGSNRFTINKLIGAEIVPFVDSKTEVNNFYGVRINADESSNVTGTITNKFSFFSDNANYTFKNDGPAIIKGLSYPTSDGGANQVLKTDGAGTLSFATITGAGSFGAVHDNGTIAATASTVDLNFNNGALQKINLTSAVGAASTVLNEPTNMNDGDRMFLIVTCTAGTVGQNGELNFKTGVNYKTTLQPLSAANGTDEQCFMFLKVGSTFLVTQVGGTMVAR